MVVGNASDRRLTPHRAVRTQQVRKPYAAGARKAGADDAIEEVGCAGAGDLVAGEAAVIHHADGIAYSSALLGDRIVPVLVAIAERVVRVLVGTEPEGALPTGDLPEASPLGSECVVERGLLHRAG